MEVHPVAESATDVTVLLAQDGPRDGEQLRTALLRAEETMSELVRELRVHSPHWNLHPVVLQTYPQGRPSVGTYVEDNEISFVFECVQTSKRDGDAADGWTAEAEVYLDGPEGRNELVHHERRTFPDALSAAEGLTDVITSVVEQVRMRPPSAMLWRAGH